MSSLAFAHPPVPECWRAASVRPGYEWGITTVILTLDEEIHIARAIACARAFSREVLVVDSFSTDRTVAIARSLGARVVQHAFVSHARQLRFAIEECGIATEWILRLDADETIGADLAARIAAGVPELAPDVSGVLLDRRHMFMGRWIRRGGRYPLHLLRLWRNGLGEVEDRWMDEHVRVTSGRLVGLHGEFADACERDIGYFVTKHNGYALREAVEVVGRRHGLLGSAPSAVGSGRQARMKRALKNRFYNRLPFGCGPLCYFVMRYLFRLGFLDGREGLIYHVLQAFWYRFLVEVRVLELERTLRGVKGREERLAALRRATGLML